MQVSSSSLYRTWISRNGGFRHWSELCLNKELMTGTLDFGANPLSRVTVASLEDIGFEVNYDNAEAFTAADLDPSCICDRRKLLGHGNVRSLTKSTRKRELREDLRQYAIEYGLKVLNDSAIANRNAWAGATFNERTSSAKKVKYIGDQVIAVLMRQDDDEFFGVVVVRE